ncbi:hypothetical protein GR255_26370, partial [Mycobacterium tuberculosis]|nr:hypothetical protein [Mycobacterium tuberculosis]
MAQGSLKKKKVRISRFLRKTLTDIMNQTEDERYRFTLEIEDSLQDLELYFNEDLVERAIMNLLHNAIRHNADGCEIEMFSVPSRGFGSRLVDNLNLSGKLEFGAGKFEKKESENQPLSPK